MEIPKLDYQQIFAGMTNLNDFGDKLVKGFSEIGFVTVENHPITPALQAEFHDACQRVFDLSLEDKLNYAIPGYKGQRGYVGLGKEQAVGAPVPDFKEFWHIGRDPGLADPMTADYYPNVFPAEVPEFGYVGQSLFLKLELVAQVLLSCLTKELGVTKDYFYEFVSSGNSILRALHYPGYFRSDMLDNRVVRAAEHTDINLITLLLGASEKGLQVQALNGEWVTVDCGPNELVVNVGDMLQRLSNKRFVSTVHRVVDPSVIDGGSVDFQSPRISIPFFCHPVSDMSLHVLDSCVDRENPPRFDYITAGGYLNQRLSELGLIQL